MRPSRNPRAAQEAPKELQRPMQKIAKKNPQKCLRGKKCLKVAISFLRFFGSHFWCNFLFIFKLIVYIMFFTTFLKNVETHFEAHFGIRAAQEGQDEPKRDIRSFKKNQKPSFSKTLKNPFVFYRFLATEASQESLKRPKKAPKRHPKNPRPQKIGIKN